jgi:hypothetical protein
VRCCVSLLALLDHISIFGLEIVVKHEIILHLCTDTVNSITSSSCCLTAAVAAVAAAAWHNSFQQWTAGSDYKAEHEIILHVHAHSQ